MSDQSQLKSIQNAVSACLVDTTRTTGYIATEDLAFQRSSNPSVAQALDRQNARLLGLAQKVIEQSVIGTEITAPELPGADALDDNWTGIVDVLDKLLEKADACLDEYTGVIKRLSPSVKETSIVQSPRRTQTSAKAYRNSEIPKPQLLFNRVPTNNEATSFKPLLRIKPHAKISLDESINPSISEDGFSKFKHPYETEVQQYQYPSSIHERADPISFLPFESTKATFVDSLEAVENMLVELRGVTEIAVDLEHHDTHSYIGLVSLMQISTRDKDWIVDTLKPWREDLQILNEVFADPKILKVFHGAHMDMIWLQRDLGLYVVGLFDTFHASNSLGYQKRSLASLLAKFVKFNAQKQYQLADWRIRPLPQELLDYARSDTHFLLYVYDNLRNELIDQSNNKRPDGDLISTVLEESKKECLQRYERPFYDTQRGMGRYGWFNLLVRTPALFTKEQFAVFRAVHEWRDTLARKEDEGINTIMPNAVIFSIAREMPIDMSSLLGCSHPISTHVRSHAGDLLKIVKEAKALGPSSPDMRELMDSHPANPKNFVEKREQPNVAQVSGARIAKLLPSNLAEHENTSTRIDTSHFWGTTIDNKVNQKGLELPGPRMQEMRLAIPLPQLTAEIINEVTTDDRDLTTPSSALNPTAEHQFVKNRKPVEDSVFVIKELRGSRKRTAEDIANGLAPNLSTPSDIKQSIPIDSNGDRNDMSIASSFSSSERSARRRAKQKAKRKLERIEQKREKGQLQNDVTDRTDGYTEEVFDYANVPSVLNRKHDNGSKSQIGPKSSFQPYSKSLDAPKGMQKPKREVAGKSITYRS